MATYKEIFGKQVKFLSSDPANEGEGQIWYNSTSGTFKSVLVTEAWSSGAPLTTARGFTGGFGTQDAALALGGSSPYTNVTEEYNGSGWAAGGALNTTRAPYGKGGTGTQTAGLAVGGYTTPGAVTNSAEEYNGTSWTAVTVYPASLEGVSGAGTQTAGVLFGGALASPYPGQTSSTEYDGTNWTASPGALNTARSGAGGAGTQTAAVAYGGYPDGPAASVTTVEEYGGATWTAVNAMPVATGAMACWGTQTSAMSAGGSTPSIFGTPAITTTMTYDGTDWTTSTAALATARGALGGAGASIPGGGVAFGGRTPAPAYVGTTEEYNRSASVVTAGAWAAGPTLNTARSALGGARNGTTTSCLAFSGYEGSPAGIKTEEFDGSSWANKNSMGTGRYNTPGTGIVTAALAAGGNAPPQSSSTEEFDGTNWAANPTGLNTARYMGPLTGTQTAALFSGGTDTSSTMITATETYNGSAWTTSPATLNTGRAAYNAGAGTQTASVIWSGYATPPGFSNASEEFNGTSWTAGNNYLLSAKGVTGAGTLAAAWSASGKAPGNSSAGFSYDGTNWSTTPSLGAAKYNCAGGGASGAGIIFAGTTGVPLLNTTEEFTAETSTLNYQTITTS